MGVIRYIISIPVLLLSILIVWISIFYWQNLRGVAPALFPPSLDIGETINTTGVPLQIPEGFTFSIFTEGLEKPRVLKQDPAGVLLVSDLSTGEIVALPDINEDGEADENKVVLSDLNRPHGMAFVCQNSEDCKFFVAEGNKVSVYDYDPDQTKAVGGKKIVDLPSGGNHVTRTLEIIKTVEGEKLLVSIGSSCNACNEKDSRRASILISDLDGANVRTYADGLRNSVFMTTNPFTEQVWATDMGRDLLGDDLPPDEINIIEDGNFYGWPNCYGKKVHDKDFDASGAAADRCEASIASHIDIPAHSSPLGLEFISGKDWSRDLQGDLLVSYHGSWNRTVPTGYKIVKYDLDAAGEIIAVEDFISGWLKENGDTFGRPVDILVNEDGTAYISDDKAGVIYLLQEN